MLKEIALVPYQIAIQKLIRSFSHIKFEHMPRAHNKHLDDLATLASKIDILGKANNVSTMRKTLQAATTDLISANLTDV